MGKQEKSGRQQQIAQTQKVTQGYKPTPAVVAANPTVKQYSQGQIINVPTNYQPNYNPTNPTYDPYLNPGSRPAIPTGSVLGAAGTIAQGRNLITTNVIGSNSRYNDYTAQYLGPRPTNSGVLDAYNYQVNPGGWSGSSVIDNYNYNLSNPTPVNQWNYQGYDWGTGNGSNESSNGGGGGYGYWRGGHGGGRGWGGDGNVAPISTGIGNDINTSLNWRFS